MVGVFEKVRAVFGRIGSGNPARRIESGNPAGRIGGGNPAHRPRLAVAGETPATVQEQVNVAATPTQEDWYWGQNTTGLEEDYFWRRLSDNWYLKDVLPGTYLEIHNQCYEAYNANPLAFAIIETTTNFCLGRGVTIRATESAVQVALDAFWNDPDNHMDTRIYTICTELSLYGEQFIRIFVNPYSGAVKIAQVDPSLIDQIETDPENIEKIKRFHRRPIGPLMSVSADAATADLPRVNPLPGERTQGTWFTATQEMYQFAINRVSNAKRGHSDLATLLPWLRRYKDFLTDRVRINKYKSAFLWDVTLTGADKRTIDRKKMEYAYPPEPGSVIIHNETEVWTAVKPEINANDVAADEHAIKLMIAVGAGLPEHYLSDGGNVNRASAAEMGLPTLLKFQRRQKYLAALLRTLLNRALTEAAKAGKLPAGLDLTYEITFPELDPSDGAVLAAGANTMAQALSLARERGWVSDETATKLFFQFAGQPDAKEN